MNQIKIKNFDFLFDKDWAMDFFSQNSKSIFDQNVSPEILEIKRSETFNKASYNMLYVVKLNEKEKRLRLSASTQADREPTYLAMKYLYDNGFNGGDVVVSKPFGYYSDFNFYIYEDIPGKTIMYELNDNLDSLKHKIVLAGQGLKKFHNLKIPDFQLWDLDWGLTVESIGKKYPKLALVIGKIRDDILSEIDKDPSLNFCHGDYQINNLVYFDNKLHILDFGSVCKSKKEFDVASFVLQLRIMLEKFSDQSNFLELKKEFLSNYGSYNERLFLLYTTLLSFRILDYFIAFPTHENNQERIPFGYKLVKENLEKIGYKIDDES